MAINNYGYPVQYPIMYPTQQSVNQQHSSGIIWVQGEAGAKAYPVAPGNSLLLMDSESDSFFIKSTDASGIPLPLRVFSYTEIVPSQQIRQPETRFDSSQFVTREEFEELKRMMHDRQPQRRENRNAEQTVSRNTKQQSNE